MTDVIDKLMPMLKNVIDKLGYLNAAWLQAMGKPLNEAQRRLLQEKQNQKIKAKLNTADKKKYETHIQPYPGAVEQMSAIQEGQLSSTLANLTNKDAVKNWAKKHIQDKEADVVAHVTGDSGELNNDFQQYLKSEEKLKDNQDIDDVFYLQRTSATRKNMINAFLAAQKAAKAEVAEKDVANHAGQTPSDSAEQGFEQTTENTASIKLKDNTSSYTFDGIKA